MGTSSEAKSDCSMLCPFVNNYYYKEQPSSHCARKDNCKEEIDYVLFQVLGISIENHIPCVTNWHLSHSSVFS